MRHAYQDAACKDHEKFVVTEETVEKWGKVLRNINHRKNLNKKE